MIRSSHILLALGLCLAGSLHAELRKFDQAMLERLGIAIHLQDSRAGAATALLLAKKIDPAREKMRGWIVEGDYEAMLVRFIREKDGQPEAFYDVIFKSDKPPVLQPPKNRTLSAAHLAQFKARSLALKSITRPASKNYNVVVLRDPAGDGFLVYALAASSEPNDIMIGGHYRFTISQDGARLLHSDELFRIHQAVSKKPKNAKNKTPVTSLSLASQENDLPFETHVFLSLQHRMPVYVAVADKHVWKVFAGKMTKVK